MTDPTTGYWSIHVGDAGVTREQFQHVAEELPGAVEAGKQVIVIDGVTLTWHPFDVMSEERIEQEARADLAAAIVAAVGDLEPKLGYEGIVWVGYDAVLDAIREASDDRRA